MQIFSYRLLLSAFLLATLITSSPVYPSKHPEIPSEQDTELFTSEEDKELDACMQGFQKNASLEDAQKSLMRLVQMIQKREQDRVQQHRKALLEKLSPETQQAVIASERAFLFVIDRLNLLAIVREVMTKIEEDVDTLSAMLQDETLHQLLEKLMTSLENGSFNDLMGGSKSPATFEAAFSPENLAREDGDDFLSLITKFAQPKSPGITREELGTLIEKLKEAQEKIPTLDTDVSSTPSDVWQNHWNDGIILLERVYNQEIYKVALSAFDALAPALRSARTQLRTTLTLLDAEHNAIIAQLQEEQKNSDQGEGITIPEDPVYFWKKTLNDYKRSITTLSLLTTGVATDSLELSETLFKCVSYGFGFAQGFFKLYDADYKKSLRQPFGPLNLNDRTRHLPQLSATPLTVNKWVLKPLITVWDFFNIRSQFMGQAAAAVLGGTIPRSALDYPQLLMVNAAAAVFCFEKLPMIPNLRTLMHIEKDAGLMRNIPGFIQKTLVTIPTVWLYYHAFHYYSFGPEASYFSPARDGYTRLWPNDYPHMIKAVSNGIKEGEEYLAYKTAGFVYQKTNPELLQTIENYSLGLIKPDLIPFIGRILLPNFVRQVIPSATGYDVNNIARFTDNDLRSWLSWTNIPISWQTTLANLELDPAKQSFFSAPFPHFLGISAAHQRVAPGDEQAFYLETQLYFYILSRVGGHLGGKVAVHHKDNVLSLLKKCVNGGLWAGETIGLLDSGDVADIEATLSLMTMQCIQLIEEIFTPGMPGRQQARLYFINTKALTPEEADENAVSAKILSTGLTMLAKGGFLKYADAHNLMKQFAQNPQDVHTLAENIFAAFVNQATRSFGEHVGSFTAQTIGSIAMHNYGPFYPQIRNRWRAQA